MKRTKFILAAITALSLAVFPPAAQAGSRKEPESVQAAAESDASGNTVGSISDADPAAPNAESESSASLAEDDAQQNVSSSPDATGAAAYTPAIDAYEAEKASFLEGNAGADPAYAEEWALQKNFQTFIFSSDVTILSIDPTYTILSADGDGSRTIVSVREINTVSYRETGSAVSEGAYAYAFSLTISGSANEITGISGTESNFSGLEEEGVHITADGITYTDPADDADADSEDDLAGASSSGNAAVHLDVTQMVAYADKWALSFNPDYTSWAGKGGDCANFSSQCLYAGGIPSDSTWYKDSGSWIDNAALRNYLTSQGYGYVIEDPSPSQIEAGDLLFYKWKSTSSRTNHVVVCVGKNNAGTPIIDSHTSAQYHVPWNYGHAAKTYLLKMDTVRDSAVSNGEDAPKPMYRLYNPNSGEHFYTASKNERDGLIPLGWRYEGIGWYAPTSGSAVYRLYNPNSGDHHYTMSAGEKYGLTKLGWKFEGVGWYSDPNKEVALYRLYDPSATTGTHNYTTSKGENNYLVKLGWKSEGVGWYGVTG